MGIKAHDSRDKSVEEKTVGEVGYYDDLDTLGRNRRRRMRWGGTTPDTESRGPGRKKQARDPNQITVELD